MRAVRYCALLLAGLGLGLSLVWIDKQWADVDAGRTQTLLAVRAGLICTVRQQGALPNVVQASALPKLCRTLAGPDALDRVASLEGIGYRRMSNTRYRLCVALHRPRSAELPGMRATLDAAGCIEEVVGPGLTETQPSWRGRRKV
ncbi:MAG: hypothetical protein AAGC92_05015 [Pseudomonadota bacterium]